MSERGCQESTLAVYASTASASGSRSGSLGELPDAVSWWFNASLKARRARERLDVTVPMGMSSVSASCR
jgi:hypothetical protein